MKLHMIYEDFAAGRIDYGDENDYRSSPTPKPVKQTRVDPDWVVMLKELYPDGSGAHGTYAARDSGRMIYFSEECGKSIRINFVWDGNSGHGYRVPSEVGSMSMSFARKLKSAAQKLQTLGYGIVAKGATGKHDRAYQSQLPKAGLQYNSGRGVYEDVAL